MAHMIRKQVIELRMDGTLDHFRIQELISRQYWRSVVPALQQAFDSFGGGDETIEVNRLVIDLGILTEDSINREEWVRGMPARLAGILEGLRMRSIPDTRVLRKPRELSVFRQWLYYMEKGYLHWSMTVTGREWYRDVLSALALDSGSVQDLRNLMTGDPVVIRRIARQHADAFLVSLVETITARRESQLRAAMKVADLPIDSGEDTGKPVTNPTNRNTRVRVWEILLRSVAEHARIPDRLEGDVTHMLTRARAPGRRDIPGGDPGTGPALNLEEEQRRISDRPETAEQEPFRASAPEGIDGEGIFVPHAGVVLLHPFLGRLFKKLGLVKDSKFTDRAAQLKALHLVHFLATGHARAEEHELVISRILCAYPLQEPVDPVVRISAKMRLEAENMMVAAISQWAILKHTSPDGLREGFLQRNGKLYTRNDSLYLQVETRSIDVLLDRLPWNLSMVLLPWMQGILRVEWR